MMGCQKDREQRMFPNGAIIVACWRATVGRVALAKITRNRLAHSGEKADYATAAWGIFACVKTLTVLSQNHMIKADFAVEFFRHSKLTAAWTKNAPNWVPSGPSAESMDLNS